MPAPDYLHDFEVCVHWYGVFSLGDRSFDWARCCTMTVRAVPCAQEIIMDYDDLGVSMAGPGRRGRRRGASRLGGTGGRAGGPVVRPSQSSEELCGADVRQLQSGFQQARRFFSLSPQGALVEAATNTSLDVQAQLCTMPMRLPVRGCAVGHDKPWWS